jgi:hypothetical protein
VSSSNPFDARLILSNTGTIQKTHAADGIDTVLKIGPVELKVNVRKGEALLSQREQRERDRTLKGYE